MTQPFFVNYVHFPILNPRYFAFAQAYLTKSSIDAEGLDQSSPEYKQLENLEIIQEN